MMVIPKILAESSGAQAVTGGCFYVGVNLYDVTGDAVLLLFRGTAATAANRIGAFGVSDEHQSITDICPGHIQCPEGIYYSLVGGSALVTIYFYR